MESRRRRELEWRLLDPPDLEQAQPAIVEKHQETVVLVGVQGGTRVVELGSNRLAAQSRSLRL
jgi:hypothetical protein